MADPAGQLGRVDGEDRSDGGDEKVPWVYLQFLTAD